MKINKQQVKAIAHETFKLLAEVFAEKQLQKAKEDSQLLEDQKLKDTIKQVIREMESENGIKEGE